MKQIILLLLFPFVLSAQVEELPDEPAVDEEMLADSSYLDEGAVMEEDDVRAPYKAPPLSPMALREVRSEAWDKAAKGMDYSKDVPTPPKERKKRETKEPEAPIDWTGLTQGMGSFLQILAVFFALSILAYGIYWMMQTPRNRSIARDGTEITLANLDEYIHETDLDRFLREAMEASNWPLAVRLYFLKSIKQLSEKEAIHWSKEKTNRDYMREMRNHTMAAQFRDVTRHFERVWYGNQVLTEAEFRRLEPEFKALLESLDKRL